MIGSIAAAPVATALELAHDADGLSEYDRLHIYNSTDPSLRIIMQADSRACPTIPGPTLQVCFTSLFPGENRDGSLTAGH